jgi:hypothetical protein
LTALALLEGEARAAFLVETFKKQKREVLLRCHERTHLETKLEQLLEQKLGLDEKLRKSTAKKLTLEALCKTLQGRNAEVNEEVRKMDTAQKAQQAELRAMFASIQAQLETQDAKSSAANAENTGLRDELQALLAAEQARSAHQDLQLGTEDAERELVEAKLAQAVEAKELAMGENITRREELKTLYTSELALREQLGEYSKKFEAVEGTLSESSGVFRTFKQEMDKMSSQVVLKHQHTNTQLYKAYTHSVIRTQKTCRRTINHTHMDTRAHTLTQVKRKEVEKLHIEKQNLECQASVLRLTDEQKQDQDVLEKLERQRDKLAELCKMLQAQKSG